MAFFESWFQPHCEGCRCFDPAPEDQDPPEEEERELPLENAIDPQTPPHTHEWGLWEIVKEGIITKPGDDNWEEDRTIGTYLDQRRRCTTCGKYELDTQVSYAIQD